MTLEKNLFEEAQLNSIISLSNNQISEMIVSMQNEELQIYINKLEEIRAESNFFFLVKRKQRTE